MVGDLVRGPGTPSTRKVVQLVGEGDRQRKTPGFPGTFTTAGLSGADLGTALDFGPGGWLWLLFGDSHTAFGPDQPQVILDDHHALGAPYNEFRPFNADAIGIAPMDVTAASLDATFSLDWYPAPDGRYATLEMPGVNLLTDKVPTGALNTADTGVIVFASGTQFPEQGSTGECSWVARWSNVTRPKTDAAYLFSSDRFKSFLFPVVGGIPGSLAPGDAELGAGVWLFGTGSPNRDSSVRLAFAPLEKLAKVGGTREADGWVFYCGTDTYGRARWSNSEIHAVPILDNSSITEVSVGWDEHLERWLMLTACPDPRGIVCRCAQHPWGPWSMPLVIFDPWVDGGYGGFMHIAGSGDGLGDPGTDEWGGEYAPLMIPRYTLGEAGRSTIRYVMSTWNPYTVILMESDLMVRRPDEFGLLVDN